ncbi:MAG: hypothetical protein ACLURP_12125 [Ruminococcus sp.]
MALQRYARQIVRGARVRKREARSPKEKYLNALADIFEEYLPDALAVPDIDSYVETHARAVYTRRPLRSAYRRD